ncbi:MAG TPA: PA14 domain-containing protein [Verrucomicrobiales bacterium]|jgi:hypothetical protein|nr:PA14 domain-containing protein [Verrucomicrobiales bacterium]
MPLNPFLSPRLTLLFTGSLAILAASPATAQFYAGRFNSNLGTNIASGDTGLRTSTLFSGGYYDVADWVDPEDAGGPQDFAVNNPIPGNTVGVGDNDFGVVGSGILHVNTTGNYVFRTGADDSSRIIIDGRNVVAMDGCCSNVDGPTITLNAGTTHFIQVIFKEGGGGANGEFSVSRNGGAFALLGTGVNASPDFTVNQSGGFALAGTVGLNAGLVGRYFVQTGDNQNKVTDTFLATNPTPTGTFVSTSINYHGGPTTIATHLGSDSSSLTAGGGNGTDNSLITLSGFLQIKQADDIDTSAVGIQVKFAFDADDNARVKIGGLSVIENDGGHGTGHWANGNTNLLSDGVGDNSSGTAVLTFNAEGLYALDAYYHNGAGGFDGQLLSSIGLTNGNVQTLPSDRMFQNVPEPTGVALLGLGGLFVASRRRRSRS